MDSIWADEVHLDTGLWRGLIGIAGAEGGNWASSRFVMF